MLRATQLNGHATKKQRMRKPLLLNQFQRQNCKWDHSTIDSCLLTWRATSGME